MLAWQVAIGVVYVSAFAIMAPLFGLAVYAAPVRALGLGCVFAVFGIWLLRRSHAGPGRNGSSFLERRKGHSLVTSGIYTRLRHPMYAAIDLIALAQAVFLGKWVIGRAGSVCLSIHCFDHVGPEERIIAEHFGVEYDACAARTGD
ncbi:MAG: isoprenylcysteine carboxylmethyltransferase family protein [Pseudomonadota bacterium]